jgi:hypothetical protein
LRLDVTFVLWVGSLVLSAFAVALFLWLMRGRPKGEERTANGTAIGAPGDAEQPKREP